MADTDFQAQFDRFETRFEILRATIDDAITEADSGSIPSMNGIEGEVQTLLSEISAAPPALQSQLQPLMGDIIAMLDTLEFKLREVRQNLEE